MNKRKTAGFITFVLVVSYLVIWSTSENRQCANVYIDFNSLNSQSKVEQCVDISSKTNALKVLGKANIVIDGTQKYGNQIVCRVDGLPKAEPIGIKKHESYIETCQTMPAEFAYWAVLVKKKQLFPNPFDVSSKWGWAKTGISEVYLEPGDSIGLVFSENGKTNFPK